VPKGGTAWPQAVRGLRQCLASLRQCLASGSAWPPSGSARPQAVPGLPQAVRGLRQCLASLRQCLASGSACFWIDSDPAVALPAPPGTPTPVAPLWDAYAATHL